MTTLADRLAYYDRLVPEVFPLFPSDFRLQPLDWALTEEIVRRPDTTIQCGDRQQTIRPIGTLDVEFLSNKLVALARGGHIDLVKDYPCGLRCPGCFSEDAVYGDTERLMTWQEVMEVIDDARRMGLTSVKFLGPGELFQNPDLFAILGAFEERALPISIFTKGAELGDDDLARSWYGKDSITSAKDLVERIARYTTVRILLGFNSFFPDIQDRMVGSFHKAGNYRLEHGVFGNRGVGDYTTKRDMALAYLGEAGFSDPARGQRLTLVNTPVGLDRTEEVAAMYVWGARRNIPVVIGPTMESGPKSLVLLRRDKRLDPRHEQLVELYMAVYSRVIDERIMTLDRVLAEGVSAYAGTAPCNQVANGLFLRLNGQVQLCPGKSDASAIYGNVHERSIIDIWVDSPNYALGRLTNNWCRAKTEGMPEEVQREVEKRLRERYG